MKTVANIKPAEWILIAFLIFLIFAPLIPVKSNENTIIETTVIENTKVANDNSDFEEAVIRVENYLSEMESVLAYTAPDEYKTSTNDVELDEAYKRLAIIEENSELMLAYVAPAVDNLIFNHERIRRDNFRPAPQDNRPSYIYHADFSDSMPYSRVPPQRTR